MRDKTSSRKFIASGSNAGKISGGAVLLYPFGNLAVREFSFPFHGTSKVRDALRIMYKPLLGESAQSVSLIPFFTGTGKKSSEGCAFIAPDGETASAEREASSVSGDCTVWPAPLAFAGEVGPDGLIIWSAGGRVTSVWIKNWTPALYSVSPPDATPDDAESAALEYIERAGGEAGKILAVDFADVSANDLQTCGARTIKLCPAYAQLDLTSRGTNIQEEREKLFDSVVRASRAALALGVIFLALAGLSYRSASVTAALPAASAVYADAFGDKSAQPVASALSKLRGARAGGPAETASSVLEDVSSAYGVSASSDIVIETFRYGAAGSDILGTAKGNEPIRLFREKLEELGYSARTDSIQTIPGGGMRFSMRISSAARGAVSP